MTYLLQKTKNGRKELVSERLLSREEAIVIVDNVFETGYLQIMENQKSCIAALGPECALIVDGNDQSLTCLPLINK